jgi:Fe-S cluster assembly scaffold IscU
MLTAASSVARSFVRARSGAILFSRSAFAAPSARSCACAGGGLRTCRAPHITPRVPLVTEAARPPPHARPRPRADHQNIVEHYENPRNVGSLPKEEKGVGTGLVGAPACGDVMKLQIRVGADGRIEDAKFKTFGCGSAIASSSVATEWVKGRTVEECLAIKNTDIAAHLKLVRVARC